MQATDTCINVRRAQNVVNKIQLNTALKNNTWLHVILKWKVNMTVTESNILCKFKTSKIIMMHVCNRMISPKVNT